jgi:hypothetical protein
MAKIIAKIRKTKKSKFDFFSEFFNRFFFHLMFLFAESNDMEHLFAINHHHYSVQSESDEILNEDSISNSVTPQVNTLFTNRDIIVGSDVGSNPDLT